MRVFPDMPGEVSLLPAGGLLLALLLAHGTALASAVAPASVAGAEPATDARTVPLDFSYRIHGTGPAIGVVFDDGRDVFVQPVGTVLPASLRVLDRPFRVQGPYLVVPGLASRIEVAGAGPSNGRTVIEYRGHRQASPQLQPQPQPQRQFDRPDSHSDCSGIVPDEQRVTVPFGTGTLQTEPGGLEPLARMVAIARGARSVTLVSQGDRSNSPIALRRAARLRELLVAAGVEPGSIVEKVQPPAASTVHVIAVRDTGPCAAPATLAGAASPVSMARTSGEVPVVQVPAAREAEAPAPDAVLPAASAPSLQANEAAAAPDLRLVFQPDRSVQATLRHYLKAHGLEVEFRAMPVLMVEAFAEVGGTDVRDVLRRALSRLGLRGEIQGNRLLVVELAR